MRRSKRALLLLLTGITIASLTISFPLEAAPGNRSSQSSVITKLAGLFRKRVRSGVTRGSLCVVTPNLGGERNLWSDRPVFIWHDGNVARVQVRLADSQTIVWEQALSNTPTSVTYSGKPLQPGQPYEVMLLDNQGKKLVKEGFLPQFVMLDVATRASVSQALKTKERQLNDEQGTVEEIVAAKAQYLLEQNLISDAFQVVYAAQEVSTELKEMTQQIAAIACNEQLSASSNETSVDVSFDSSFATLSELKPQ
jgi:hypothetical protein